MQSKLNYMTTQIIENFISSYLETAKWCDIDSDVDNKGFTQHTKELAAVDCNEFINRLKDSFTPTEIEAIIGYQGQDLGSLAGHDFWLTRNHHGAGFFDKEVYDTLAVNGCSRLTKVAQSFPSCNVIVNRKWLFIE